MMYVLVLLAAVAFAFINGMNDSSALSGTPLATRAAHFWQTRLITAVGIGAGLLLGGDAVGRTVAFDLFMDGRVDASVGVAVWAAALVGAIAWGLIARALGVPTSATHAFVGSLIGGALVLGGSNAVLNWGVESLRTQHHPSGLLKVMAGLVLSPAIGLGLGWLLFHLGAMVLMFTGRHRSRLVRALEWPALLSQSWFYGANDAHLVTGILTGATVAHGGGLATPHYLVLAAMLCGIAKGSASILLEMGRKFCRIGPLEAFTSQLAASSGVGCASLFGVPASSTQVAVSALVGVGGAWRAGHVRWREVRVVLIAWLLTIPAAAVVGALVGLLLRAFV